MGNNSKIETREKVLKKKVNEEKKIRKYKIKNIK